jgi:hypothetical protein
VLLFFFKWAPRHEGVSGEWRYSSTHSLTSALDGGEWSASRSGRFTQGKSPRYPLDRRLGGPQSRSGHGMVKRKIPSPRQESSPRTPIVQLEAQRYTDWAITGVWYCKEKLLICNWDHNILHLFKRWVSTDKSPLIHRWTVTQPQKEESAGSGFVQWQHKLCGGQQRVYTLVATKL